MADLDSRFLAKEGKRLYRSKRHGCFKMMHHPMWGTFLTPVEDPEGEEIAEEDLQGIEVVENFNKIQADKWAAWVSLAMHMCPKEPKDKTRLSLGGGLSKLFRGSNALEVSIVLLRNKQDPSIWDMWVPDQEVSKGSVKANFNRMCNLITGERLETPEKTNPIPKEWFHAGSTHSHNTMDAFFSSTDDANELHVQGVHIVLGDVDTEEGTYEYEASIVMRGQRKYVTLDEVVDLDTPSNQTFHPNVLGYIRREKPRYISYGSDDFEGSVWDGSALSLDTSEKTPAALDSADPSARVDISDGGKNDY